MLGPRFPTEKTLWILFLVHSVPYEGRRLKVGCREESEPGTDGKRCPREGGRKSGEVSPGGAHRLRH